MTDPLPMTCALLRGVWVTVVAIAPLSAQSDEPIGRTLRDPGRVREHEISRGGTRHRSTLSLTSSARFTTSTSVGAHLRAVHRDLLPYVSTIGSASYSSIDHHPGNDNRIKVGVEFGKRLTRLGTFDVGYDWTNTLDVSTDGEAFAELNLRMREESATLGWIAYYDHSKKKSGTTKDGASVAVIGRWTAPPGLRIQAEYDFKSDFNGEDSFSARLVQGLGASRNPTLNRSMTDGASHRDRIDPLGQRR